MKLNVVFTRSTMVEIEVGNDFNPHNQESVELFDQLVDEKLQEPLDWGNPQRANISSVMSQEYCGDSEDLLELIG